MGRSSRVRVTGPLAPHTVGFEQKLTKQGYTANSASDQLRLMAHASRWLTSGGLEVGEVTLRLVTRWWSRRRRASFTRFTSRSPSVASPNE